MKIEFDQAKSEKNLRERQLSFERASYFNWSSAVIASDLRNEYPKARYIAVGYLDNRLHVLCFTQASDAIRIISFRKANRREAEKHGKPLTID